MSLMAANEESDPSAILNGFWVTLFSVLMISTSKRVYLSTLLEAFIICSHCFAPDNVFSVILSMLFLVIS